MDRQQPPTPPASNPYPPNAPNAPNAPWAGAPGTPPYQQQGGPAAGYPGGPWPPPPLQPPPQPPMQNPPKRHTGAIFASLGVVLVLAIAVALVVVTGAASRFTGKSAVTTTTPTVSTVIAQVPAVSGQTVSITAPATVAVPGTAMVAVPGAAIATGSRDLTPVAGTQTAATARSTAKPVATTAAAGGQATPGSRPTVKPSPAAALVASPAAAGISGITATVDISKTQVHGLNQPVTVPGWTVTVTKVERPGTELTWNTDNDPATASGTWVVVAVTMKKTASGTDGATADAFTVRSGQGFADPVPDDYWLQLGMYATFTHTQPFSKSVPPGATVTYSIPFDVATDATDLRLVFTTDTVTSAVFAI